MIDLDAACTEALVVVRYELKDGQLRRFFEDQPTRPVVRRKSGRGGGDRARCPALELEVLVEVQPHERDARNDKGPRRMP